ncbi:MAG: extracellular solute-binding protein, partial [Candidatus Wallbacteria bacterium]|nr:extracellular solute-binding protein [Candidatus Wallbacteria bacterium]
MNRSLFCSAILLFSSLMISGCNSQPQEKTHLTVWLDMREQQLELVKQARSRFQQKHQGTEIAIDIVPFHGSKDLILSENTVKPDLFLGVNDWLTELCEKKAVSEFPPDKRSGEFPPQLLDPLTKDGNLMALPYSFEYLALFYHRGTVEPPDSVEDLYRLKVQFHDGPVLAYDIANLYYHFPFLSCFMEQDFGLSTLFSDAMEQSVSVIKKLIDEGLIPENCTYELARNLFLSGQVPLFLTGPWDMELMNPDKIGIAPLFSLNGKSCRPFLGIKCFFIGSASRNPDLAREFLYSILSPDFQKKLLENRIPPACRSAVPAADDKFQSFFYQNIGP